MHCRALLALFGLLLVLAPARATEIPVSGGPRQILISYRSDPGHRIAFRNYLLHAETQRLEALKQQGGLKSFQILFSAFVTPRTWDAMVILEFASYADTARWRKIEHTMPGGLDPEGLALAQPVETDSADLSWEGSDPQAGKDGVFYVIPYEYNVLDQYKKYVDAYVIPQVTGWIKEGVLSRYRIYLNRDPVGPNWDSLFVYQYRDLEAYGRREDVLAKVRGPLRQDPAWKAMNDIKSTIRTEGENTIAERLSGD